MAVGDDLGWRLQHGELPRRVRGCPQTTARGRLCVGLLRIATFLNVTLPIGGRIALPSSINTYIAVLKNTALLYVISYEWFDDVGAANQRSTLETLEIAHYPRCRLLEPRLGSLDCDPLAGSTPCAPESR